MSTTNSTPNTPHAGQAGSPYRSELDALRERKESLEKELAGVRQQATELSTLKAREEQLARELEGVDARLRNGGVPKRALPLLDQVRVASPCSASWDKMVGDEHVRFCLSCEKNVYNLSSLSRDAAEALLEKHAGGEMCVRYYQRADGTILTQDCPEGVKKKRRKKLALAIAGAGAMAAATAIAFGRETCHTQGIVAGGIQPLPPPEPSAMGTTAPPSDPTPPTAPTVTAKLGELPPKAMPLTGVVAPRPQPLTGKRAPVQVGKVTR
ncbi:hypothetical protein AKJ09_01813 [Labilithrix luteola]|uniref:Uncharacterized protein n=1 Tax=Labilithrix luteola TaxID=1391654 RepID=A0A0K1PPV2_9BACT|nr:hypothetical protein [Labilithrix luteola]AKU95149.1 hypothetical protein AKJ09_01813 [Labilithrix luteola]